MPNDFDFEGGGPLEDFDFDDHVGDGGMELRALKEEIRILKGRRKKIGFRNWCIRHVPGSDAFSESPRLFCTMITLAFTSTAGGGVALIVGKWGHPGGIVFGTLLLCPATAICAWYRISAIDEEREINSDLDIKLEELQEQVSLLQKWQRKQAMELKRRHKLLAQKEKAERKARYAEEKPVDFDAMEQSPMRKRGPAQEFDPVRAVAWIILFWLLSHAIAGVIGLIIGIIFLIVFAISSR